MNDTTGNVVPFRKKEFTGKRRQVESCPARTLGWPSKPKERFDLFDAWHCVAMQVARKHGIETRFLAVTKIVMRWKNGTIVASNAELAERAGGWSVETIKREIAQCAKAGIITIKGSGRRHADGIRFTRTRTIRLAVPAKPDPGIKLPDFEYEEEERDDGRYR